VNKIEGNIYLLKFQSEKKLSSFSFTGTAAVQYSSISATEQQQSALTAVTVAAGWTERLLESCNDNEVIYFLININYYYLMFVQRIMHQMHNE